MKRATIKDISLSIGVSTSTVSRALNDHPDISDSLKEQIRQVAKSLNYHPNLQAVNLRKNKSNLIGLIIPEISMFFFPSVINGIEEVVHKNGYQLLVLQSHNSLERETQNIQICIDHFIDGILLSLSAESQSITHLNGLSELGIPLVLFDKSLDQNKFDQIIIDDFEAAKQSTELLINNGAKNIVGLFGNPEMSITQQRVKGFEAALKHAGLVSEETIYAHSFTDCNQKCIELLKHKKPDAYFCMSDEVSAGLYPALNQYKLTVREDCQVIAMSDGYLPYLLNPPLSHFHHSGFEIGKAAAERLFFRINQQKETEPAKVLYWQGQIVRLGSTK